MPWSIYEKIILEGEKYKCPSVEPQGTNEPLLDQDLEKQIKFATDHGFIDIMLNSNGTLLSESRARSILKSGITRIRFSLDAATKETYEKVRLGGQYEVTMKNIERFLKIKKDEHYELPVVGVNFVKQKANPRGNTRGLNDKTSLLALEAVAYTYPHLSWVREICVPHISNHWRRNNLRSGITAVAILTGDVRRYISRNNRATRVRSNLMQKRGENHSKPKARVTNIRPGTS